MCEKNTRVYFEDEYCAAVYKKAGEDSQSFFTAFFPDKPFIAAVNRLDTPVSGIMLLAFSAHIQTLFLHAFENGTVKKEYWAVCERPEPVPGCFIEIGAFQRLEHRIGFHTKTQKAFVGDASAESVPLSETVCYDKTARPAAPAKNGSRCKRRRSTGAPLKKAVLHWTLCGKGKRYDFIRIHPETGRTHQIRVQMAAAGRPIKGDLKYGARRSDPVGGIRLHSVGLCFAHPISGRRIAVKAPPLQPDTLWKACTEACLTNEPFTNEPQTDTGTTEGAPSLINSEQRL